MVIKESGCFRLFPVLEKVFVACSYKIDGIDDGWYGEFARSQEDALVEATVTVGVGERIPCGEDVGGVR